MEPDASSGPSADAAMASDRGSDAEALTKLILESPAKVVVVAGAKNSGKTQFIREWIIQKLRERQRTVVADCAEGLTDVALAALADNCIVVLDSFDRFLRLPDTQRKAGLDRLLSDQRRATAVVVTSSQSLGDLLTLRKQEPEILDRLFELCELRLSVELPRYQPRPDAAPVQYSSRDLAVIEEGLAGIGETAVTPLLLSIIDADFRSGSYDPQGGLRGILDRYLDRRLRSVDTIEGFGEGASAVAREVLKELVENAGHKVLNGLAERLDVASELPGQCYEWLINCSHLVRQVDGEALEVQPPQVRALIQASVDEDRRVRAKAERLLADGLEGRRKVGTILPRDRFAEVNAQQLLLKTDPDQAAFLTLCAFRFFPNEDPGPVNYWFRRVGDRSLQVQTLLEGLSDPTPRARRRAAGMLRDFDEPKVHGQLGLLALEDPAAEVRQQAVDGLAAFANKEPIREVLEKEASEGSGDGRIRAIEALRIFTDDRCARFLRNLVDQPSPPVVREAAIDALARTVSLEAVSSLVEIGLHDKDAVDRERARTALAALDSEKLTTHGITCALRDFAGPEQSRRSWWARLGHWPAAVGILLFNGLFHGAALLLLRSWWLGLGFLLVEAVLVVLMLAESSIGAMLLWFLNGVVSVPVSAAMARRKLPPDDGGFRRVMLDAFLAATMLGSGALLHGLGQVVAGRPGRSLHFFFVEALAILAIFPTFALESLFTLDITRGWFDKFSQSLLYIYRYGGFVVSWGYACFALFQDERKGSASPWTSERHSDVLRALLGGRQSAFAVLARLRSDDQQNARKLLRHFGEDIPGGQVIAVLERERAQTPDEILSCLARHKDKEGYSNVVAELGRLFDESDAGCRQKIAGVLTRFPTDVSIDCLRNRRPQLGRAGVAHYVAAAGLRFFRGWHPAVRAVAVVSLPLVILLVGEGYITSRNPAWPLIKQLRKKIMHHEQPDSVSRSAMFMAQEYPEGSAQELATLFGESPHGQGLAMGLSVVASCPDSSARSLAIGALVEGAGKEAKREVSLQALHGAASSPNVYKELVGGLKKLFDDSQKQLGAERIFETQAFQARIATILAAAAPKSAEARQTISQKAAVFGELLKTSPDRQAKTDIMTALIAAADGPSIAAIKGFILHDGLPAQKANRGGSVVTDPATARTAGDLSKIQREARQEAIDRLLNLETQEARDTITELRQEAEVRRKQNEKSLLVELEARLQPRFGREAAVKFDTQARSLQAQGKLDKALDAARQAVNADADFADAHGTLGSVLFALANRQTGESRDASLKEALTQLQHAAEISPAYSWAYYMQGLILRDQGKYSQAEQAVRESLRTDPGYPWSYRLLREIYLAQNRDRAAVVEFRRFQKLYPEVAEIYKQIAYVYHERIARNDPSAYEEAYKSNSQLLELQRKNDPSQAESTEVNLVECSLTTGRHREVIDRAKRLAARLRDADWQMPLYLFMLAAQVLQGTHSEALDTLSQVEALQKRAFRDPNAEATWVYDGTLLYLERRVQSPQIASLVELVRAFNGGPARVPPEAYRALREALAPTGSTRP